MTSEVINATEIMTARNTQAALASATLPTTLPAALPPTQGAATVKTPRRKTRAASRPEFFKESFKTAFKSNPAKTAAESLDLHAREKEAWERSMGATLALLKQAHDMIDHAEQVIFDQQKRIHQLEKVATTDELTGILNRRGFYDAFKGEVERCNRGLIDGGLLVIIDLDNFKNINDTYGHAAGDAALRLVSHMLQNEIRAMDAVARLGGDEFVLLLSHTNKTEAAARAQNIGWKLNNLSLAWCGHEIPVRASLGLKEYCAGDTTEQIFTAADAGLYQQKEIRKTRSEKAIPETAAQAVTV